VAYPRQSRRQSPRDVLSRQISWYYLVVLMERCCAAMSIVALTGQG
jgi:hypothetical protein